MGWNRLLALTKINMYSLDGIAKQEGNRENEGWTEVSAGLTSGVRFVLLC